MSDRKLMAHSDAVETPSRKLTRPRPPDAADRIPRPNTREDAEERYVAARDAWTSAMSTARSGSSADLAALAIAQEAYEAALAEKDRWANSPRTQSPVTPDRPRGLDAVVGQELSWRRIHQNDQEHQQHRPSGIRGLLRRFRDR